jgi:hypothetical protein
VPETTTETVSDITAVAAWARQNASSADQTRVHMIIETFARAKQQQFANQPTEWEIDWFWRGSAKAFYRMALVDRETQQELWGYS